MVICAVAGGTGGIGRALVETLLQNPQHETIVLARKGTDTSKISARVIIVDYSDVDSLARTLDDYKVHTVISALRVLDTATSDAEVNLVKASSKAFTPKRFIASAWGIEYTEDTPVGAARARTLVELGKTNLEWTRFNNGYFLDYYGPPSMTSYMARVIYVLDVANKKAGIPGTGNEPMTFTYTFDVAKFVLAALDLPKWDQLMYCYGEKTTWNDFVRQAEEITDSKFEVAYDPPEKLKRGEITELPSHGAVSIYSKEMLQGLMAIWGGYVLDGKYDMPTDEALNKVFPEIRPLTVKGVLEMWMRH